MARVLGLISGTSCDAIDGAVLETDGRCIEAFGACRCYVWQAEERALIFAASKALAEGRPTAPEVQQAEAAVTQAHIRFVRDFLAAEPNWQPELIGFHGQTIFHDPKQGITRQLGDGAELANATGLPVIGQFRQQDVAAGGEGAPLAPLYHWALAEYHNLPRPLAVLNLGGVGNLTYIGEGEPEKALLAFDTGPANAALDDWAEHHWGSNYDPEGRHALAGKADPALLASLLADGFFTRPPPKSLDRAEFALPAILRRLPELANLNPENGAALLSAFTVHSVAAGFRFFPEMPQGLIITGGGRHNRSLVQGLAELAPFPVQNAETVGWRGDSLEAECFAFLAARAKQGLPLTFPATTGVAQPLSGGVLYPSPPPHAGGSPNSGEPS